MKESKLIQHNLIPLALIAANVALAQLIYLMAENSDMYRFIINMICLCLLGYGTFKANKVTLLLGIIGYTSFLLFTLLS